MQDPLLQQGSYDEEPLPIRAYAVDIAYTLYVQLGGEHETEPVS